MYELLHSATYLCVIHECTIFSCLTLCFSLGYSSTLQSDWSLSRYHAHLLIIQVSVINQTASKNVSAVVIGWFRDFLENRTNLPGAWYYTSKYYFLKEISSTTRI